jgi:precorrin-6x reductase
MKLLIFGGTTEGRLLAQRLAGTGHEVAVSVATPLGAEELSGLPGLSVLVGRRDQGEMERLLAGFDRCVDATHPYAVQASGNIRRACQTAGVPLKRLLRRESGPVPALWADSAPQAARLLADTRGNILLTTGAKELAAFACLSPERLYPRVLPVVESILACQKIGVPTRNIIAMHGPFSRELNQVILRQYEIQYLVTKDGGAAGGFLEKSEAARETGAELVVIRRPREDGEELEAILAWLEAGGCPAG